MIKPAVSVVVETITARECATAVTLPDHLSDTIAALHAQTYPRELMEIIVVIDDQVDGTTVDELRRRYPSVKLGSSGCSNYFAAKNAGAALAAGAIIALVDGDCVPASDWLEALVGRFERGADAVAGRTRYTGESLLARTFSVPDFANVVEDQAGAASAFNLNNVAFRREVLLANPLEARIRRNGGCFFLYARLRAAGARIVYEERAIVEHGLDIRGLGFVRKHFDRGYDAVTVYRLDERALLRGTPLFRRVGAAALAPIVGRRIVLDWVRLARHHRQIGISPFALPYFGAVVVGTRMIELAGGLLAALHPQR